MFAGWFAYGDVEMVNSARLAAYAENLGVGLFRTTYPGLHYALGDDPYTTPSQDDAPWYDPGAPESGRFCGFGGLSVVGIDKGQSGRTHVERLGDGSVLGPLRAGAREISFKVSAFAQDQQAMSYGLAWLSTVLRGSVYNAGCGGDSLCFFTSDPSCDEDTLGCGDTEFRTLFDVGVLDSVTVSARGSTSGSCGDGGVYAEVDFTLVAGNPWIFCDPVTVIEPGELQAHYTGLATGGQQPDPGCVEETDCLADPWCPDPVLPPIPPVPTDPCYPTDSYTAQRFVLPIPADVLPEWLDKVPVIRVAAGSTAMRRLNIRFFSNALGRDCTNFLDPCTSCVELNVTYLPPGSTLVVDGRTETAWVDCAGGQGSAVAEPRLYGRNGELFQWPLFECNTSMCVEVLVHASHRAADAQISLEMATRQDVA